MNFISVLSKIAEENGGIIETKCAVKNGISRSILSMLCKKGMISRIAQGQYVLPDTIGDELYAIGKRSARIVFSHETALFLHGISDRTPFEHTVTASSGCIPSVLIKNECKVYYIKPELFGLGKTILETPSGNPVAAYNLERTICDIVRSRNRIGTETYLNALRQYAANPKKNLNKLNEYAMKMKISGIIRQQLEVLL